MKRTKFNSIITEPNDSVVWKNPTEISIKIIRRVLLMMSIQFLPTRDELKLTKF